MDTTQSTPGDPPITYADAPFDDPDADIIIQSSDNVHFRVHKVILSVASPFFKSMFTLPQPPNAEVRHGADVVPLSEDSKVVEKLLRFCYPGNGPTFADFTEARNAVGAMVKYEMGDDAKKYLLEFIKEAPTRVYLAACRYRWFDVAEKAAKESLRLPLLGAEVEELEYVPAKAYHRLLQYHNNCGEAAGSAAAVVTWLSRGTWVWFWCGNCQAGPLEIAVGRLSVREWFTQYLKWAEHVLEERPAPENISQLKDILPFAKIATNRCSVCASLAVEDLSAFASGLFTQQIDLVVGKVILDLKDL